MFRLVEWYAASKTPKWCIRFVFRVFCSIVVVINAEQATLRKLSPSFYFTHDLLKDNFTIRDRFQYKWGGTKSTVLVLCKKFTPKFMWNLNEALAVWVVDKWIISKVTVFIIKLPFFRCHLLLPEVSVDYHLTLKQCHCNSVVRGLRVTFTSILEQAPVCLT